MLAEDWRKIVSITLAEDWPKIVTIMLTEDWLKIVCIMLAEKWLKVVCTYMLPRNVYNSSTSAGKRKQMLVQNPIHTPS